MMWPSNSTPGCRLVQNRVNTVGLRLLSLERLCLQIWPLAGAWELGFSECSHHCLMGKGGLLHRDCTNNVVYAEHLPSFWESGILVHVRPRVLTWPAPSKNLGHWVSNELPGGWHLTRVITTQCWMNEVCSEWLHPERTLACWVWFPQGFSVCTSPLWWFCFVSFHCM